MYTPASVGVAGLVTPTYSDILDYLIAQYQATFGPSVYLGVDSADYQDIAPRALQAFDANQALQSLYTSFNLQQAVGASLDLLGRQIGTPRKTSSYSTVIVTLTGTPGTVVTNGIARDVNGRYWNVASPSTIGPGGTVASLATAQQPGVITAGIAEITSIASPTAGWTSVTNAEAATPGATVEADSEYRARLLIAQTKPSLSLLAGTAASIAAVADVTRSVVYENSAGYSCGYGVVNTADSGGSPAESNVVSLIVGYPFDVSQEGQPITIDGDVFTIDQVLDSDLLTLTTAPGTRTGVSYYVGDGIALGPAHSISCVVEGGAAADVAQAIYDNRGVGAYVAGDTEVVVTDPNNSGISATMRYYVLAYTEVYVALEIRALTGYTTATQAAIVTGIVDYLNSLGTGESVVYSELFGAALTARPDPEHPLFSIRSIEFGAGGSPASMGTDDIPIDFRSAASSVAANVTITLV